MEKKIRSINLFVSVVSFLSPPERAKSSLSAVSKTFRTACKWPALVRADVKSAETVMMAEAETAPGGFYLNKYTFEYGNASEKGVTSPGYIAYYWLVFKRHRELPLSKLMQPLTRLPLDFWMDADTVQQTNRFKANGDNRYDGMGYLKDPTERLRRVTIFRQLADLFRDAPPTLCYTCERFVANPDLLPAFCPWCKKTMENGDTDRVAFLMLASTGRVVVPADDRAYIPRAWSIEPLEQMLASYQARLLTKQQMEIV